MKKYLLSLAIFFIAVSGATAQTHGSEKLNFTLANLLRDPAVQNKNISLLVKGDVQAIRQITELNGGIFRYEVGNIAAITVPVLSLPVLYSSPKVLRMELPVGNYVTMNDSMRSVIHANEVHAGVPPLPQGYDGTGVVIGIIDTGVDLTHPDLLDTNGNTRVKHLWDQRKPIASNTPQPYGYGQEWNNTEIDAGLAVSSNDVQYSGHGTHVTGIATGDGSAIGKNMGVAPGADIIEVAFDFNNTTNPTYIDAVNYIFSKAQLLGKPCVINASLGDYYGSHDGYDLQSQMISTLLNQQPGRSMVASAGNAGTIPFHLGYNVTSDTSFTWVRHNPSYPNTYFQVWGDTSTFKNIMFSIGADANTTAASYRGRLSFRNILYNLGVFKQDTLFSSSGTRLAIIQSFGSIQGPAYLLEFNIVPDSNTYAWRLMTTGSGRLDIWKFYDGTGLPGFVNTNLPSAALVPEIIYYQLPDSNSTIVSGFQCLDNVITVGNFGNRNFYIDFNGNPYNDPSVIPGQIAPNSSWGPTRDGRIKPDIAAPGGLMLSCGQLSLLAIWQNQPGNVIKIAEGGFHFRDGGTSSSSPVVAGIAALYLQQNPNATVMQTKNAILQCAVQDNFTGVNLPDNVWGYGKADALNTLTNCSLTSLAESQPGSTDVLVFPNPAHSGDIIQIKESPGNKVGADEMMIADPLGRIVAKTSAKSRDGYFSLPVNSVKAGLYTVTLLHQGVKLVNARLIVID